MNGTVFHYAVMEPRDDHAECYAQRNQVIAMHEGMGYRRGGAYNGHFCIHGGFWLSYEGPNQATGDTWANLNLEAWCYLATVGTPVTAEAQQTAYELTFRNPRDRIHPHSDFFATSCCGDPLREWIAAGALPPAGIPAPKETHDMERTVHNSDLGQNDGWWYFPPTGVAVASTSEQAFLLRGTGVPTFEVPGPAILAAIKAREVAYPPVPPPGDCPPGLADASNDELVAELDRRLA